MADPLISPSEVSPQAIKLAGTVLEKHGAEKATAYLLAELVASVDQVRDLLDIYKQGGFSQKA